MAVYDEWEAPTRTVAGLSRDALTHPPDLVMRGYLCPPNACAALCLPPVSTPRDRRRRDSYDLKGSTTRNGYSTLRLSIHAGIQCVTDFRRGP
jgi:hypothetical protein